MSQTTALVFQSRSASDNHMLPAPYMGLLDASCLAYRYGSNSHRATPPETTMAAASYVVTLLVKGNELMSQLRATN